MNKRIKEIIVVIYQHKILYADTNINSFHKVLKALEKTTPTKETIKRNLDKSKVYFFSNEYGNMYQICKFENPNYVGLKKD